MTGFGEPLPRFTELAAGIRRIVAPNPSMMTGPGTNTYLLGNAAIGVLDPGPAIDEHLERILTLAGAPIRWILVTHTHPDHSPAARKLAAETGAERIGMPPPPGRHQDGGFAPDRTVADGDHLVIDTIDLEVVHTPGHASNHVCYRHGAQDWLFTGDHVIDGSTVVIDPPDGDMGAYLESLGRCRDLDCAALLPGHGDVIREPRPVFDWLIRHRLDREARVVDALTANPGHTAHELVPFVYRDVAPKLYGWAERSLTAHLLKLAAEGRATEARGRWSPA